MSNGAIVPWNIYEKFNIEKQFSRILARRFYLEGIFMNKLCDFNVEKKKLKWNFQIMKIEWYHMKH